MPQCEQCIVALVAMASEGQPQDSSPLVPVSTSSLFISTRNGLESKRLPASPVKSVEDRVPGANDTVTVTGVDHQTGNTGESGDAGGLDLLRNSSDETAYSHTPLSRSASSASSAPLSRSASMDTALGTIDLSQCAGSTAALRAQSHGKPIIEQHPTSADVILSNPDAADHRSTAMNDRNQRLPDAAPIAVDYILTGITPMISPYNEDQAEQTSAQRVAPAMVGRSLSSCRSATEQSINRPEPQHCLSDEIGAMTPCVQ